MAINLNLSRSMRLTAVVTLASLGAFTAKTYASASASLAAPIRTFAKATEITGSVAPPPDSEDITREFAVGLGWALCPDKPTMPPLEGATSCEGLMPSLEDVAVTLKPQPTSNPDWRLWSGRVIQKTKFRNLEGTLELLASFAKVEGKTYVFMEGRLFTSASAKQATYFGGTASDWDQLQLTTAYGPFIPISFGSQKDLWVPYMNFARKGYPN